MSARHDVDTRRLGRTMGFLATAAFLGLGWFSFHDVIERREHPNRNLVVESGASELVLRRDRAGHYRFPGWINGRPVRFLLDTGATHVAVPAHLAEALQLAPCARGTAVTANGSVAVRETSIGELAFGPFRLTGVRGHVNPAGSATPYPASAARNARGPSAAPGRPLLSRTPTSSGRALADAGTGEIRASLSKEEAIEVAKEQVMEGASVAKIEYLQKVNGHHEYREKPLPAWAITFNNPDCTVYVSAELGTFEAIRHNQWRAFDFLWMFHTMDYAGRDNFNNWHLRILSVFGLVTVISGFTLYVISSRTLKKLTI